MTSKKKESSKYAYEFYKQMGYRATEDDETNHAFNQFCDKIKREAYKEVLKEYDKYYSHILFREWLEAKIKEVEKK